MNGKRIRVIIGHYGSGKTEFAVNFAMKLATEKKKTAIIDLDVVNPYFRSREKEDMFKEAGIEITSSILGNKNPVDMPSLEPGNLKPIQNKEYSVVIDVGGDHVGAKVLARYKKHLIDEETEYLFVVNAYRPDTSTYDKVIKQIDDIEAELGRRISGLVNNTHMLHNTKVEDIEVGDKLVKEIAEKMNIPIKYTVCKEDLCSDLPEYISGEIFPIKIYMREDWMQY